MIKEIVADKRDVDHPSGDVIVPILNTFGPTNSMPGVIYLQFDPILLRLCDAFDIDNVACSVAVRQNIV